MKNKIQNYWSNITNKKVFIATAIAILFHTIGLVGFLFLNKPLFALATPFNLMLSFGLLIYTQKNKSKAFYFFIAMACGIGFAAEAFGVNTGLLFGSYSYTNVLGFKILGVPIIIGLNWFIVIYCSGVTTHTIINKAISAIATETKLPPKTLNAISVIIDGATLAVFFDWVLEPVAIKLNFWHWANADKIPLYNYISWFVISLIILTIFHFSKFDKQNKFAVNLLLIQLMFFLLLQTFLK
ncbi:MAG: carotenoid biosynthesis protein [Ferruginibacter sp.]|nr:carotenoid biosynthesis protein [Ferruginibacter sp.]